jgi:hypothetical protein
MNAKRREKHGKRQMKINIKTQRERNIGRKEREKRRERQNTHEKETSLKNYRENKWCKLFMF